MGVYIIFSNFSVLFFYWASVNAKIINEINELVTEKKTIKIKVGPSEISNQINNQSPVEVCSTCVACPHMFVDSTNLEEHNQNVHQQVHQCTECNTFFTKKEDLESHMYSAHIFLYKPTEFSQIFPTTIKMHRKVSQQFKTGSVHPLAVTLYSRKKNSKRMTSVTATTNYTKKAKSTSKI